MDGYVCVDVRVCVCVWVCMGVGGWTCVCGCQHILLTLSVSLYLSLCTGAQHDSNCGHRQRHDPGTWVRGEGYDAKQKLDVLNWFMSGAPLCQSESARAKRQRKRKAPEGEEAPARVAPARRRRKLLPEKFM
jgi:hypothetical protein